MSQRKVLHDLAKRRFYMPLSTGESVLIDYSHVRDNIYNFHHTETPTSHRGQGLAAIVAKEAMDYVVQNNWVPILSCWYLQEYRARNSDLDAYIKKKESDMAHAPSKI